MAALAIGLQDGADLLEVTYWFRLRARFSGGYCRIHSKGAQEYEERFNHRFVVQLIRQRHANAYSVALTDRNVSLELFHVL